MLWGTWLLLLFMILNERYQVFLIPEIFPNTVAVLLAGLHIYNLKYCQCKADTCCSSNK